MVNYNWPAFATCCPHHCVIFSCVSSIAQVSHISEQAKRLTWNLLFISPCIMWDHWTLLNVDSCFQGMCFVFNWNVPQFRFVLLFRGNGRKNSPSGDFWRRYYPVFQMLAFLGFHVDNIMNRIIVWSVQIMCDTTFNWYSPSSLFIIFARHSAFAGECSVFIRVTALYLFWNVFTRMAIWSERS